MHKLSQQMKGCFGMKRHRRSDSSFSSANEQRSSSEMTIVHVSMEESRRSAQAEKARQHSTPMNYWAVTSDEEDAASDGEQSVFSPNIPSREPSYIDVLTAENDQEFMPLRSAPKPAVRTRAKSQKRRFSRQEWREKTDMALFGSCKVSQEQGSDSEVSIESGDAWDGRSTPVDRDSGIDPDFMLNSPPPKTVKQISGISIREGQDPHSLCANALNELLFTTNAQIDIHLHDMLEDYINGRGISNLTDDFESIIEHTYNGFITAARSILDIAEETRDQEAVDLVYSTNNNLNRTASPPPIRRYASSKYAGSMESLLSEIVNCYTHQTEEETSSTRNLGWRTGANRANPRISTATESQMADFGIDVIKYNKEQMRRYAVTTLSKYISGQVLVSTGIENDLADKLDESAEALRRINQQITTLESLYKDKEEMKSDTDLSGLRKRAFRYRRTVKQLKNDAKDASNVRRIFEMALLEVQLL
ncbi:hypothetical protein H4R22_002325 [Coemansia sp. RSA 1290]|nr:hypothetical protein H4R22_002325 [Coemansia sp. RSA 1290]